MVQGFPLAELAKAIHANLIGNPHLLITGVNTLESATDTEASFYANPRYEEAMRASQAGVICIHPNTPLPEGKNFLVTEDPSRAFQRIAELLLIANTPKSGFIGIHPSAVIDPTAQIGKRVTIGPHAVIDAHTSIGDDTVIGPLVSIGPGVSIGNKCTLHPHVTIREGCRIGSEVILQPGVVIGSCGFGFTTDQKGKHHKLDQLGIVIIEDNVEIGANTTIDRARFKATLIKKGTMIDNLVQVAHNVEIGEDCILVAQAGIAGSSKLGNRVIIGGQAGVAGHIELESGVVVTSQGGVSKSLSKGVYRSAPPVQPIASFQREAVHVRRLPQYVEQIKELQRAIAELEQKLTPS
ncbi:MAG: UDP-3-O-(3-hydroxymyristoyl)glucosamine N-acyltransferase [Simkaniaceae bacterium]|nr:UDP-3-O-(3-hydroxymyristoyl)glucosamine N-acyltransferase [Simkaniaceae bacterium]